MSFFLHFLMKTVTLEQKKTLFIDVVFGVFAHLILAHSCCLACLIYVILMIETKNVNICYHIKLLKFR